MNRNLYLFDFDGTLTCKDTLFDFLKFSFPKVYFVNYLIFIPLFVVSKLKIIDAGFVKEMFISKFLKGKSYVEINQLAQNYFEQNHQELIYSKADEYIKSLSNYNDKFIVSASVDFWIQPFADYYEMGLICTKAKYDEQGFFTGKFASPNCNYQEKKNRIEKEIDLSLYDQIIAFGDTKGDEAMFSIATKSNFRCFN
ncbi:HAD-IB family phosphatase [Empedobacter sp. GD03797]|uniref:HAD-IB family phosphatase n=1 Tax=Empedobacter sp. GD03797 TaxID=2975382 RepID=UPI00244955B9|nr:HAD-IB family phosphatase [Empedobacter sp. GD03797]MDH1882394.1 HAD-IB family phosphatase [Empedobacter sp. GD03797]